MFSFINQLIAKPQYSKLIHWGKLVSITGSAQIAIQAFGFACGILLIRYLPSNEYAWYTLSNTMLGVMVMLADGGISTGVMARGGVVWHDKSKLGIVLSTGLSLRRKFALGSLSVTLPILFYLLRHIGASWLTSLLIVLSLIPAFYSSLSDSLLELPLKLNQAIIPLQKNQVYVSIGRLLLSLMTIFILPFTFIAILVSGVPRLIGNISLRKMATEFADLTPHSNADIEDDILKIVKRSLPSVIYYCLSAQITIWIISIFGNSVSMAQVGALGRLVMPLTLITGLCNTLIIPRFSRLTSHKHNLSIYYSKIIFGLVIMSSVIIIIIYLFSTKFLWILGEKYAGLEYELLLIIIAGCISLIAGISFSLNCSRGWVAKPLIAICINMSPIVLGSYLFDLSQLIGVLYLNIFSALSMLILNTTYGYYKINSTQKSLFVKYPDEVLSEL